MEILKKLILTLLLTAPLSAQIVIEEVGSDSSKNRSVTIGSDSVAGTKKVWRAAFLSLALPGMGQYYLENKTKGTVYLSMDLVLLGGSIFTEATSRRTYHNSINFARSNAQTVSQRDWKDNYWNDIAFGDSTITTSADWNAELAKGRDFERQYIGEDTWDWGNSMDAKNSYIRQRARAEKWHTAAFVFVGGMLVNRVVSFVDARISANLYNSSLFSSISVVPHYSILTDIGGLTVSGTF